MTYNVFGGTLNLTQPKAATVVLCFLPIRSAVELQAGATVCRHLRMPARAATSPATLSLVWAAPARRLQFVAVISLVDFTNSHMSAMSPCLLPRPCTSSLSDYVVPTTSALTVPCETLAFGRILSLSSYFSITFYTFVIFVHFVCFHPTGTSVLM